MKHNLKNNREIDPDEIFIDSRNLPQFDTDQFEGRLEKPISKVSLISILVIFFLIIGTYSIKVWSLQIKYGEQYVIKSENNRLRSTPLFAPRGVIYDRNGVELVWNEPGNEGDFPIRKYIDIPGLAHVIGYVQYPSKDNAGFYYQEDFEGLDGVEKYYNKTLMGHNGSRIIEVDAVVNIQSENITRPPKQGENITLSIDSRVQSEMYKAIENIAKQVGFSGGAGIMMDVRNGEIIALTSYPEYNMEVMSSRIDQDMVRAYLSDKNKPFLDRAVGGLYAPGSIVKPYVALGALSENIIDPNKEILSTGSISVQNDYDPDKQTIFKDWKALGYVDMRHAIAMSSDVYFYEVGGGYKDQKGLGIDNINKYMNMFGFGKGIEESFFSGPDGIVPNPDWKKETFDGEVWTLGNTYHTAIGQYGFQASPIQIVRAMSAIATEGILRDPSILKDVDGKIINKINIRKEYFDIIHDGMRLGATIGTGKALNLPYIEMATKSGTAELGIEKSSVNSWITGFFPYK
ncbi:MAG TPA: penicillin-binding transpeptidase domain-containing protein, partial [Candidatus Paceibacterota bacterium]